MWESVNLREKIILGLMAALLITGALWRVQQSGSPSGMERLNGGAAVPGEREDREPEIITVHLVGAVNKPGIYRVPEGSRVYELLEMGEGHTEEADLSMVNLARPLYDGEQVFIPRYGDPGPSNQGESKININKATAEELSSLPGIGLVRAAAIVEHREKYGYFADITELMDVSGIGDGIFNSVEDLITIY